MKRENNKKIFEICMIISLVFHIIIFQVVRIGKHSIIPSQINPIKIEVVNIPKTWQKKKIHKPIAPPRPTVPVPMEAEYIPEDLTIVITVLDLSKIPRPPEPPEEYDYENYTFISYQTAPKIIGVLTSSGLEVGGMGAVKKQIRYPEIAKKMGIEGTTIVGLLIDKRGYVVKTIILRSAWIGFDEEALRVAKMIKFKPAQQSDLPVKVWLSMPFRFRLY